MRRGAEFGQALRRPVPVFGEDELDARDRRTAHFHVRVAPRRKPRIAAEILDAHVMPADERALAVHHDDLPMIAEVDLEAVHELARGRERMRLDAARAQRVHVAMRQVEAADAVVEEVHAHARLGLLDERVLEHVAECVGAHDEELHDDIAFGRGDRFEDRGEGGVAVDEHARRVAAQERHAGQPLQRADSRIAEIGRRSRRDLAAHAAGIDERRAVSGASLRAPESHSAGFERLRRISISSRRSSI